VPFFLSPGPALGRGIGTDLYPLDLPPYWYVLLNPGLSISTRWVYESLDLKALARCGAPALAAFNGERPEDWVANDLETVTLSRYPALRDLLARLSEAGARAGGMSGSGPTLFGVFDQAETAQAAAHLIRQQFTGWLAVARGLTQGDGDAGWENQAWII